MSDKLEFLEAALATGERELHHLLAGEIEEAEELAKNRGQLLEMAWNCADPESIGLLRDGAEQHDVARRAVHVGQAGTAQIPDVHDAAQVIGGVVLAGGLGQTNGVEVGHTREHFGLIAVTSNDAAAVAENADDTAVLPVGLFVFEGEFQHAEQIVRAINGDLIVHAVGVGGPMGCFLFDVGHEAGPGPSFELVQQGSLVFRHLLPPVGFEDYRLNQLTRAPCGLARRLGRLPSDQPCSLADGVLFNWGSGNET